MLPSPPAVLRFFSRFWPKIEEKKSGEPFTFVGYTVFFGSPNCFLKILFSEQSDILVFFGSPIVSRFFG